MATHNLGRVAYADKGAYNSSTTYINKDVVQYNNGSYVLQADTATGIVPTNTSYWTPMQDPTALNQATASANTAAQSANTAANSAVKAAETANTVMNNTASPIRKSATGKFIELDNAANKPLAGLKLYGRTEQIKTTGKNLINVQTESGSQGGVSYHSKNGVVIVNGTSTSTAYIWLCNAITLSPGTYTISGKPDGFQTSQCAVYDDNHHLAVEGTTTLTDSAEIRPYIIIHPGVTFNNAVFKPQLERGSVATDFEPYSGGYASPSPNWPQPLVSPGDNGSIGVKTMGKNLLPINSINTNQNDAGLIELTYLPAGIYTLSADITKYADDTATNTRMSCSIIYTDGQTEGFSTDFDVNKAENDGITRRKQRSFLIRADKKVQRIVIYALDYSVLGSGRNAKAENIQIEYGPTATAYEPYKDGGTLAISTPNGLPGIKVSSGGNYVDTQGQMWLCDEIDFERRVRKPKVRKIVFDGSPDENWVGPILLGNLPNLVAYHVLDYVVSRPLVMCDRFQTLVPNVSGQSDGTIGVGVEGVDSTHGGVFFGVRGIAETNAEWRAWLAAHPVTVMIPAPDNEPEVSISASELASYRAMSTFDPYTVVYSDSDVEMTVDYIGETEKFVHEAIDDRAAPPIVETAIGSIVSVNDSAHRPLHGLRLYGMTRQATTTGKNLLPNTVSTTVNNGITFVAGADGTITANGTSMVDYDAYCIVGTATLVVGEKYLLTGCPSGGGFGIGLDGTGIYDWGDGIEFTAETENYTAVLIVSKNKTISNIVFKPMIRPASVTDATYEPYTGGIPSPNPNYPQELVNVGAGGSIGAYARGKNLLKYPYGHTGIAEAAGISFDDFGDGRVSLSGTATGTDGIAYILQEFAAGNRAELQPGTYTISGNPTSNMLMPFYFYESQNAEKESFVHNAVGGNSVTFTLDRTMYYGAYIWISSGMTVDAMVSPQLELGSVATAYEPYKDGGSVSASTPNGLPGIPVSSGGNYVDEHGQQWVCDEIDLARGVYIQRVGRILIDSTNTSLSLQNSGGLCQAFASPSPYVPGYAVDPSPYMMCDTLPSVPRKNAAEQAINGASLTGDHILLRVAGVTTIAGMREWLAANPTTVLYQPAQPIAIETPIPASELVAYRAMSSQYPNTTVYNAAGAGMAVDYIADTKAYIDKKLAAIAAALIE